MITYKEANEIAKKASPKSDQEDYNQARYVLNQAIRERAEKGDFSCHILYLKNSEGLGRVIKEMTESGYAVIVRSNGALNPSIEISWK